MQRLVTTTTRLGVQLNTILTTSKAARLGLALGTAYLVLLVFHMAPLMAGPLITAGTNLRNELVTTGEAIGQGAIVVAFLGLMFENVRANHMGALMWLVIGGAGVWGSAAFINTILA